MLSPTTTHTTHPNYSNPTLVTDALCTPTSYTSVGELTHISSLHSPPTRTQLNTMTSPTSTHLTYPMYTTPSYILLLFLPLALYALVNQIIKQGASSYAPAETMVYTKHSPPSTTTPYPIDNTPTYCLSHCRQVPSTQWSMS